MSEVEKLFEEFKGRLVEVECECDEKEVEDEGIKYADSLEYTISKFSDEEGYCWSQVEQTYEKGALDFAEPREKRIAELEETNKKISDECHKLVDTLEKKQNKVAELQAIVEKQNADILTLKGLSERQRLQIEALDGEIPWKDIKDKSEVIKENTELKEQNNKAKEIIRDFLSVTIDYIDKEDKNYSFIDEAEQFLKERENER